MERKKEKLARKKMSDDRAPEARQRREKLQKKPHEKKGKNRVLTTIILL